jgi:hypothetical protein
MARPSKKGLDYFPLDVDFFNDEKIEFVSARFDEKGELITVKLLCAIYRNGYYLKFDDDMALLFAKRVGKNTSHLLVNDVVSELVKRGFFDRSIFNSFSIITSAGIQRRFLQAANERKDVEIIADYWLIDVPKNTRNTTFLVSPPTISINPPINSIKPSTNPQSKEKESKEENIIPPIVPPLSENGKLAGGGNSNVTPKTWRDDFQIYLQSLRCAYKQFINDKSYIAERERYMPNVDIKLTLEKACKDFWATEAGWKHKKKARKTVEIDWKATFNNALDLKGNKVWKIKEQQENENQKTVTVVD